jgi:uncharacterized membrane protein YqaE (UPF0057 family)
MIFTKWAFMGMSLSLILTACTIEKRVASRGYHIEWKGRYTSAGPQSHKPEKEGHAEADNALVKRTAGSELNSEKTLAAVGAASVVRPTNAETGTLQEKSSPARAAAVTERSAKAPAVKESKHTVSKIEAGSKAKKARGESNSDGDDMLILLYILCILLPFVAVGIATHWQVEPVLLNILLSILCWIPGVIHAFIVVNRER